MTARLFTEPRLARRKNRAIALVCASVLLASQGCHDFEPGEGGGGQAQQQPLIFSLAKVGAGFNMASRRAASACLEFTADIIPLNQQVSTSFVAYSFEDLKDKFDIYNRDNRPSVTWESRLYDLFFETHILGGGSQDILYIMVYFESAVVRVNPLSGQPRIADDGSSVCEEVSGDPNENGSSVDDFVARCGTHFLSEQRYGGQAILALNITDMPIGVQRALRQAAEVEVIAADEPTRASMIIARIAQVLEDAGLPKLVAIQTSGILHPDQRFGSTDLFSLDAWPDYVEQVQATYSEPLAEGLIEDPRYGLQIEQRFAPYPEQSLYVCAEIDQLGHEQLSCYQSLVDSDSPMRSVHVRQVKARLDFLLDPANAARVVYLEGEDGSQYYRAMRDKITQCEEDIEGLRERCEVQLNAAPLALCERGCQLPAECEGTEDIKREFGEGPRYEILPLRQAPTPTINVDDYWLGAGTSAVIASVERRLCVFAGMQGPFDSTAESIQLHGDLGTWNFGVRAGIGPNGYQRGVFGQAYCVDRDTFVTSGVNAWLETRFHEHDTDSNTTFTEPSLGDHVIGLGGISGRLKGSGERSFVTQSEDVGLKSKFSSRSLQGRLRTWAISFGLSNFQDSNARWYRLGPQANLVELELSSQDALSPHSDPQTMGGLRTVQAMLAPKDEALCYLTRVGGRFDGGGEKILIKEREGMWILEVTAGIEHGRPKPVSAAVRCLKYVQ